MESKIEKQLSIVIQLVAIIPTLLLIFGIMNSYVFYNVLNIDIFNIIPPSNILYFLIFYFLRYLAELITILSFFIIYGSLMITFILNRKIYFHPSHTNNLLELNKFKKNVFFVRSVFFLFIVICILIYLFLYYITHDIDTQFVYNHLNHYNSLLVLLMLFYTSSICVRIIDSKTNNNIKSSYNVFSKISLLLKFYYKFIYKRDVYIVYLILVISSILVSFEQAYKIKHNISRIRFSISTENEKYTSKEHIFIGAVGDYYILSDTIINDITYIPKDKILKATFSNQKK